MKFCYAVFAVFLLMFAVCTVYGGDKPDQCRPDQVRPDQCRPDQWKPDQCIQKRLVACCKPCPPMCCKPCCKPCPVFCCKPCCKPSIVYDDKCKRVYKQPGVGCYVIVKDCGWRIRAHKVAKVNRRACRSRL